MIRGQMMDQPLLISGLIRHAEAYHGDTEIISRTVEGPIHRYTWREAGKRSRQLAHALTSLGVRQGECVGTLAWNGYRHLEAFYAVSGMGAISHPINPRLFANQIADIINHAEDAVLMFDMNFLPLVEQIHGQLKTVRTYVMMSTRANMPRDTVLGDLLCYEDLVKSHSDQFDWPVLDESTAASLCYTSGASGQPRGVLYSHRSTLLHAFASSLPDSLDISAETCVMPVVPMFHINGWGLPYSCAMNGSKLVLPGPKLDGINLYELIENERVTMAAGVPTVWMMLMQHVEQNHLRLNHLKRVIVGGSTATEQLISQLSGYGVEVRQMWGTTELTASGTTSTPKFKHQNSDSATLRQLQLRQGRPLFGVDLRIVDDAGKPLPHDGNAFGNLQVKGPWVVAQYYRGERDGSHTADGWFNTGDVVTIDADGYMRITDRTKDVIKSGGEWISSLELEDILLTHPAVGECAAIGIPHPKWDERPLMVVVLKPGAVVNREELLSYYDGKVARWWTPDDVVIVGDLPRTGSGKLNKTRLRELYRDYKWQK